MTSAQAHQDHIDLLAALKAAGHNVSLWRNDPSNLRAYAEAVGFDPAAQTDHDDDDQPGLSETQLAEFLAREFEARGEFGEHFLHEFLDDGNLTDDDYTDIVKSAALFSEVGGVTTADAGVVLTLEDGAEYQITVVRSR